MVSSLEYLGWSLCLSIAFLSVISGFLTLYLLSRMKRWSGYLQLVLDLTICQGIYDLSYFLLPFFDIKSARILYELTSTFGGISSTLWCNVIVYVTWKIVISLRSVNILEQVQTFPTSLLLTCLYTPYSSPCLVLHPQHRYYLLAISITSGLLACFDSYFLDNYVILMIYFLIKTISLFVNICFYLLIMYKVSPSVFSRGPPSPHPGLHS
jgi:hypothetical protein